MKREEKKQKMIEIFEPYMKGSLVRELIDKCLDLDNPDTNFIEDIKKEMYMWYSFILTDEQVKEYLEYRKKKDGIILDYFDTTEREDYAYYLSKKITGLDWPMNGDSEETKETFYKSLTENAPKFGYKWAIDYQ